MVSISDESEFAWILEGRDKMVGGAESPTWRGNFVSHALPNTFSAYCKIFHPMYEDKSISDFTITWNDFEKTKPHFPAAEWRRKLLLERRHLRLRANRVLLRTLAQRYDLTLKPEFSVQSFSKVFPLGSLPRYLVGPHEGTLDVETSAAIVEVLTPFTRAENIFFRFSDYLMNDLPHLFAGELAEVTTFFEKPQFGGTPEYWWPRDHSWCLCTDWDLTFTLLGGSQPMIASCMRHPAVECVSVNLDTRIDYLADRDKSSEL